jgi:hypothetical protein
MDDASAQVEWERMQGFGRRLARRRTLATAAGMGVTAVGFAVAAALLASGTTEKEILLAPIAVAITIGWAVRNRLWPRGQFA